MSFDFQKYMDSLKNEAGKNDIGKMIASATLCRESNP